jgi:hypothetical protein
VKTSGYEAAVRPVPPSGKDNERVFKGLLGMDDERYRALVERKSSTDHQWGARPTGRARFSSARPPHEHEDGGRDPQPL